MRSNKLSAEMSTGQFIVTWSDQPNFRPDPTRRSQAKYWPDKLTMTRKEKLNSQNTVGPINVFHVVEFVVNKVLNVVS